MEDHKCEHFKNLSQGAESKLTSEDISFYIYYYTLLFFILLVNIVGNSFVILAFIRQKKLR